MYVTSSFLWLDFACESDLWIGYSWRTFCFLKNFTDSFVMKVGGNDLIARRLLK